MFALWKEGAVVGECQLLELLLRPERLRDLVELAISLVGSLEVSVDGDGPIRSWHLELEVGIVSDEDIPTTVTTISPTATQIQGPITRARARQLNYQVLSFLGTLPNLHENMLLPKTDVFVTLRNNGPSEELMDNYWSMIVHGDGSKHTRVEDDATHGDSRVVKPL